MNKLRLFNLVLLVLLGVAAGLAKVMVVPDELAFFQQFGLTEMVLVGFGGLQLIASLLLAIRHTRLAGLAVLGLTLVGSSLMIFYSGQIAFGVFSLLPVLMVYFAYKFPWKTAPQTKQNAEVG
jgi:hypothetical protein